MLSFCPVCEQQRYVQAYSETDDLKEEYILQSLCERNDNGGNVSNTLK
jgi:hypothetical protein